MSGLDFRRAAGIRLRINRASGSGIYVSVGSKFISFVSMRSQTAEVEMLSVGQQTGAAEVAVLWLDGGARVGLRVNEAELVKAFLDECGVKP